MKPEPGTAVIARVETYLAYEDLSPVARDFVTEFDFYAQPLAARLESTHHEVLTGAPEPIRCHTYDDAAVIAGLAC